MSESQKAPTKKSKKGKTIALNDFLADTSKTVTVRATTNWSDIVDHEEAETKPILIDIGALPTAPRGASEIDPNTIPTNPPFVAVVANLSFEIDDENLRRIFADLNPKSARVLRENNRSRGIGFVEFETRDNLIDALKRADKEIYGRKMRITVSDKTDMQVDGGRGSFGGQRSNRGGGGSGGGEGRPEMDEKWTRAKTRPDDASDDRPSSGFNRDRQNRGDHGRSNMGGGSRDNHGNDYGYGYPRRSDDRGGVHSGGNRDYNRQGQRNRYQDDDNRSNSGVDRPRYSGRYSDTRDTRDRNRTNDETPDDQREPPRERQRLQLQPRTKPLEEFEPLSGSSSSINNVAANAGQSSISNADESSSPLANTSTQQNQDLSLNEHRDDNEAQESRNSDDRVNTSDEQSTVKPSRGAGASIFGGAKPVDTTAREREIEKKLKELEMTSSETTGDTEEKPAPSSSRPSHYRSDRDGYRGKRSSHNDEHRDGRDDGRSGQGLDHQHKREYSGRQYEDEGRRRHNDDHPPSARRGGHDRERYGGGQQRRDHDSVRSNKYNHPDRDHDRNNNRQREREDRNQDPDEFSTYGRPHNNQHGDGFSRNRPRGGQRQNVPATDDSSKLQLSNKFCMLNDDDLDDDDNEDNDAQSPNYFALTIFTNRVDIISEEFMCLFDF
ncbi:unnamed protein product [Adineta ricciae]|uniref:RRM domain-containing protein n=1 Tax=Adineta ricciae TaxID=249248 RepID=A0A815BES1_ADIRI|nr:unnamed protein product [Adineta ricciae]